MKYFWSASSLEGTISPCQCCCYMYNVQLLRALNVWFQLNSLRAKNGANEHNWLLHTDQSGSVSLCITQALQAGWRDGQSIFRSHTRSFRIQTRDACDSRARTGTGATDKGPVYVLSGPAGGEIYPTASSRACAQCEWKDGDRSYSSVIWSWKCRRGQVQLKCPRLLTCLLVSRWLWGRNEEYERKLFQRLISVKINKKSKLSKNATFLNQIGSSLGWNQPPQTWLSHHATLCFSASSFVRFNAEIFMNEIAIFKC